MVQLREAVVVSGVRTANGVFGGSLSGIDAPVLGSLVLKEALNRAHIEGKELDEVIMGTHFQAGIKANSARQASIYAGIPVEVPAWTPNKNCGTGLKAVNLAAQMVMMGEADIIAAGGCETMSRIPYLIQGHRFGIKMGSSQLLDSMLYDGLVDPFMNYHMGITAENVAVKCDITRQMQDEFAFRSHALAAKAEKEGKFIDEILPVEVKNKKKKFMYDHDETIRHDISLEKLSALKPCFKEGGTVTAGNASGCNDAAAAVIIMSKEKAIQLGLKPIVTFRAFASTGVDPSIMGYGPVPAITKLLKKADLTVDDIDLFELNEAFAAQAVACVKDLHIDINKVNVNGGAIALGHPVGCTGARLLVTLMNELTRTQKRYGVISLCIGGGQGIATLVERCN
ncbi:thiolase family protein [Megasphaera paucivorans]|uniref:acetyl-CoA C-acetyltransferase n=1 Tax=Megasphaera paucivorans TaxID=349095 RepID=A0A1G9WVL9_9FIRM|nr:thiolase family protein [Megasphaera paucivorans]SDM88674.1 acetyl-CoA acetyltransferase [Megasphaera paucivorans]